MKKKIVSLLLLCATTLFFLGGTNSVSAAGEVDIYPYDQLACLEALPECTGSAKVGDSSWDVVFNGYRYHQVRGSVRFVSDFVDGDSNGEFTAAEITSLEWSSFGGYIVNNTESEARLVANDSRAELVGGSQDFIWFYFDSTGKLVMFEDSASGWYYLKNTGTAEAPVWEYPTADEIVEYDGMLDDGVAFPEGVVRGGIRIALTSDGYLAEPIGKTVGDWKNTNYDAANLESKQSVVVDYNPIHIVIPSGGAVLSAGFLDRSNLNVNAFTKAAPAALIAGTEVVTAEYTEQPGVFQGLEALDVDGSVAGVQVVVEYRLPEYSLPTGVTASWRDMFDADGLVINRTQNIGYKVNITDLAGNVLETVTYAYTPDDPETTEVNEEAYTPDKTVLTEIDTNSFGTTYYAKYEVTTPEGVVAERIVEIGVGVIPPKFVGVANKYFTEDDFGIDLLDGITADNGYGTDITELINVTYPSGFNPFKPDAGTYEINLAFDYTHTIPEVLPTASLKDVNYTAAPILYNPVDAVIGINTTASAKFVIVTNEAASRLNPDALGWGSVACLFRDGKLAERYDGFTSYSFTNSAGTNADTAAKFSNWIRGFKNNGLAENEVLVLAHGGVAATVLRIANLEYDSSFAFTTGSLEEKHVISRATTYVLTVDDKTAPVAIPVDLKYTVEAGSYTSVDDAIRANVVATDNLTSREGLSVSVISNGGMSLTTPGTYNVTVEVTDEAGNSSQVTFAVTVVEAKASQSTVDEVVDKVNGLNAIMPIFAIILVAFGFAALSFGGSVLFFKFFGKKKAE